MSSHNNIENTFNSKFYGSLRFVHRMGLAYKMDCHNGCVNALHFNSSGSRLASGSDDLSIIIWDWSRAEPVVNYDSGHRGNVFQVFLNCSCVCLQHQLLSLKLKSSTNHLFAFLMFQRQNFCLCVETPILSLVPVTDTYDLRNCHQVEHFIPLVD